MERDEEAFSFGRGRARVCRVSDKYQSSFDNDDGDKKSWAECVNTKY